MSWGPGHTWSESWLNLVPALASGVGLTVTFPSLGSLAHELEALRPLRGCLGRRTWVPACESGVRAGRPEVGADVTSLPPTFLHFTREESEDALL